MQPVNLCPLSSSHEKRLQQTMCRRRLCLHVKAADLGPKARMSPILVWMRKLETRIERGLTTNDLQILVDQSVVKEAEDALAAVHDIPEAMTDSTLYASVSTGAVPSAASPRVFRWPSSVACRFHQTVTTPLCCHIHVSPNLVASLLFIHVSPNLVLFNGST